jgi:hypothetical protein
MKERQKGFVKRTTLIVLLVIGLLLAGVVTLLPRPFSDDLSLIGKGSSSVVLTHDKNLLVSQTTMELLNKVRSDYEPNVHFLVVDVATLKGREFMQRHQVGAVSLLFFGPDGRRKSLLEAGGTEPAVRAALDKISSD